MNLSDYFGGSNRSKFCKMYIRQFNDRIEISVQRGDPFQRRPTIEDTTIRNLHFRPAGKDIVVLRKAEHVLQCNSSIKRAIPIYRRVFGILLFDVPDYFSDDEIFALAPLEDLGEDALSWGDIDEIESIVFTKYRVDLGTQNAYKTFEADIIITYLRNCGKSLVIRGRLVDATFKIKFRGTKAWRTVKLYAGNAACYTRDSNVFAAERWLMLRRFIIRSGAVVESEVNDETLASD